MRVGDGAPGGCRSRPERPFDVRRDATRDALFAEGMNTGMTGYEMAIADRKRALFKRMLERLPRDEQGNGNVEATGRGGW